MEVRKLATNKKTFRARARAPASLRLRSKGVLLGAVLTGCQAPAAGWEGWDGGRGRARRLRVWLMSTSLAPPLHNSTDLLQTCGAGMRTPALPGFAAPSMSGTYSPRTNRRSTRGSVCPNSAQGDGGSAALPEDATCEWGNQPENSRGARSGGASGAGPLSWPSRRPSREPGRAAGVWCLWPPLQRRGDALGAGGGAATPVVTGPDHLAPRQAMLFISQHHCWSCAGCLLPPSASLLSTNPFSHQQVVAYVNHVLRKGGVRLPAIKNLSADVADATHLAHFLRLVAPAFQLQSSFKRHVDVKDICVDQFAQMIRFLRKDNTAADTFLGSVSADLLAAGYLSAVRDFLWCIIKLHIVGDDISLLAWVKAVTVCFLCVLIRIRSV